MSLPREKLYTIEDIEALPEGTRAELIDGQIYYLASPSPRHQEIVSDINTDINMYIRSTGGKCKSYPAPLAVYLDKDSKNYLEPDISVICDPDKLDDKGCHGAPDWIVEVVSPGSNRMDYFIKLFKYRTAGVREYWVVDPTKDRVTVYDFSDESVEEYRLSDSIKVHIYDDLEITVKK